VGFLLISFLQRRWLMLAGFVVLLLSVLLPWHSSIRLVGGSLGIVLMLVQIPLTIRAELRKRKAPRSISRSNE